MKILFVLLACFAIGCGDDGSDIDSDEEARRAYLGLDTSIEKSITLGFAGFNAADNANIPPQMTAGDVLGMLTISGKVDQGSSDNKGMRLNVGMVGYNDGPVVIESDDDEPLEIDITYDTDSVVEMQPFLSMQLKSIPTGTLDGTLVGDYSMSGDLDGVVTLNLTFSGQLQAGPNDTVIRMPGSTTVTGTATSGDGSYDVSLTL